MKVALLPDRGVVKVSGEEARKFLNGIVTADVGKVAPDAPAFAALLTPQGKILFDFIIAEASEEDGGGFYLDCPSALAPGLLERLKFYRLRAKVVLEDLSDRLGVLAIWQGAGTTDYGLVYQDPRLPELGLRAIIPPEAAYKAAAEMGADFADPEDYEAYRIACGIPRGGVDFVYGDAFPHETDMDQLHGVDFDKGCYIGQEVVSRMHHRGSARTRIVPVAYDGFAPEDGIVVTAGDKTLGTMGSAADGRGLAMLRLDRVEDALASGKPITAGGIALRLTKPGWATFAWPGEKEPAGVR